jgi:hypothetical protein
VSSIALPEQLAYTRHTEVIKPSSPNLFELTDTPDMFQTALLLADASGN